MMYRSRRTAILTLLLTALAILGAPRPSVAEPPAERKFTTEDLAFFENDVVPILRQACLNCHSEGMVRGKLRLDTREGVLKGGKNGPAVDLDRPEKSLLLKAIAYEDKDLKMPPSGKLRDTKIEKLTKWVKAGLPWTPGGKALRPLDEGKITEEAKRYWAYQPVKRPEIPAVKNKDWVRNPIDALLLVQLEAKGLRPAPAADRVALIRRATYDLIGLPPTPEEVDAFVNDKSPDAYEKLIDNLLASPHYGEKWGRHWLDLVRFAETNGYERDGPKPFAWRFRDYVIKSFNEDKPYDRFIKEQLAGDEMPGYNPDAVTATGFYRLGLWDDEPADPLQARYDELDDWVATTGQVFLGMTMNCARCHDHKGDPILQADYYRLLAFFQDVQHYSATRDVRSSFNLSDISPPDQRAKYEQDLKNRQARVDELTAQMTKIEDAAIKKMPAEDQRAAEGVDRPAVISRKLKMFLTAEEAKEYDKLKADVDFLKKKPEPAARELALSVNNCLVRVPQTTVMTRGNPHAPGAKVEPGFPTVLGFDDPKIPAPEKGAKSSGRRTVLADWIASKENPSTARVIMNRIWQFHFGKGIVPSPSDFGKLGEPVTNQPLLDWLASEFVARGWRMKAMHKLIMTSSAYQMSAKADAKALQIDPANTLQWRFNMRRLTAEEVRDSILAVSGKLNLKMGGPSIYPKIPKEVLAGQSRPGEGWGNSSPEEASRRTVYVHIKRSLQVPVLAQHDQADTDSSCPVRYTTTVPTQALGMLNGEFTNEQAAAFAERLRKELPGDVSAQVRRAIRLTTGRQPGDDEVKKDVAFLTEIQAKGKVNEQEALKRYCLLALNTNEFIYLD